MKIIFFKLKKNLPRTTDILYKFFFFFLFKAKRYVRITSWMLSIPYLLNQSKNKSRRLLLIYDFCVQPFSIGDFIVAHESTLILCEKFGLSLVDIALVNDSKLSNPSKEFSNITNEESLYHLASILPVAQINQNLGSVFFFNSNRQLQNFVKENLENYHVWPSAAQYAGKDYLHMVGFNEIIHKHFNEFGRIPYLHCRKFLVQWSNDFYSKNTDSQIPVTVNLRNNKAFGHNRNSNLEIWIEFFKYCIGRYQVKFIIICSWQEVDERLKELDNVILAKDFHTGIEQDLALISTSAIHIGVSSGPFTIAMFNNKPYLMFSWDADPSRYKCIVKEGDFYRFTFSSALQRFTKSSESFKLLSDEFEVMWNSIDHGNYLMNEGISFKREEKNLTWLR